MRDRRRRRGAGELTPKFFGRQSHFERLALHAQDFRLQLIERRVAPLEVLRAIGQRFALPLEFSFLSRLIFAELATQLLQAIAHFRALLMKIAPFVFELNFAAGDQRFDLLQIPFALVELLQYLDRPSRPSRVIVWAHTSHLGDARATEMGARGELNVGQLMRERYGAAVVSIGFTT